MSKTRLGNSIADVVHNYLISHSFTWREKHGIIPSLTLVNPKSRSKAFIYQAGATFQFRSDMCYILSCGSWFDFFGAFYYIPHLRFGNEFDIGMKAKMDM